MGNVALIGCGYWGSKLKRYIEENQKFNLKYVCNSKSDLNEVWNDKQITAVVVATPNETHYPIVKSALLHGKNVLSEKPLAFKIEECEELKQITLDSNRLLLVEYTYTFSKALNKAQSMVREGEIGKILGLEMAVRHLGRFKRESVYWLLGSHMLSVLDMFLPIKDLSFEKTDLVTYDGEVETGVLSFKKGEVSGQIVVSLNYPGKETRIVIYGEKGTIIYDTVSQPSLQVEKYKRLEWTVDLKLPREHMEFRIDEANNLRYTIEYFSQALEGKAEGNIDRAVAITRILEMLEGGRSGSKAMNTRNVDRTNQRQEIGEIKKLVEKIDGHHSVSDREGEFLYNVSKNCVGKGVIVEIGSWKGRSTIWLGRGSKAGNKVKVYAIDPHTGAPIHREIYGRVWTFEEFKRNIKTSNVDDVVMPVVKTSEEAEKDWNEPVELLWIDGNHEYKFVKLDFDKWSPHLIDGGIIAFHDTIFHTMTGPKKVVVENLYKSDKFVDIGLIGSITFAKRVNRNSVKDRLKNKYALLLRYIYQLPRPKYDLFLRFVYEHRRYLPHPIIELGKKIVKRIQ